MPPRGHPSDPHALYRIPSDETWGRERRLCNFGQPSSAVCETSGCGRFGCWPSSARGAVTRHRNAPSSRTIYIRSRLGSPQFHRMPCPCRQDAPEAAVTRMVRHSRITCIRVTIAIEGQVFILRSRPLFLLSLSLQSRGNVFQEQV
jgi:hypothetical protein